MYAPGFSTIDINSSGSISPDAIIKLSIPSKYCSVVIVPSSNWLIKSWALLLSTANAAAVLISVSYCCLVKYDLYARWRKNMGGTS